MTIFLLSTLWTLTLTLIVGLCVTAHDGDLQDVQ